MPWDSVDLTNRSWDDLKDMSWSDVRVIECDMEMKTRIMHDYPRVRNFIMEGIRDETFNVTVPLYPELRRYIEWAYDIEIDGEEDPFHTITTLETTIPILGRKNK